MQRIKITIILVCCSISVSLFAQPKLLKEEMYIGAQGGVLASMVNFSPTIDQNPLHCHLGATAGLVYRYIGHKVCGLQVELNYMGRGWQEYSAESGYAYRRQLDYIEIPLLMHLYFGDYSRSTKCARGFLNLGPQIGFLVNEKGSNIPTAYSSAWNSGKGSGTYHQYVPLENRFDWGIAGALGFYYITQHAGVYQFEARFNYSLGSNFSTSRMDYFTSSNNMNLSFTVAYFWKL